MSALSALLALLLLAACAPQPSRPPVLRAVKTTVLSAEPASAPSRYAAEVKARHEARLAFQVGGRLTRREVEVGQPVRAGALLATLDAADLELGHAAAKAAQDAAATAATQALADLARSQALRAQGFIGEAALERQAAASRAAQSQLEQAHAAARLQARQASYTDLRAPGDAIVTAVLAERAAVVAAGQPVVVLALDGPREAVFSVPEDRLAMVRALVGQARALKVMLWGRDEPVAATVREVAAAADPLTRTYLVKATLDGDAALGRSAVVTWASAARSSVQLPLQAVFERDGRASVWLLDPQAMTVSPREVGVAGAAADRVTIAFGLNPGDEVVVAGVHVLTPGEKVRRFQPQRGGVPATAAP